MPNVNTGYLRDFFNNPSGTFLFNLANNKANPDHNSAINFNMKMKILSFRDRFDILLETRAVPVKLKNEIIKGVAE